MDSRLSPPGDRCRYTAPCLMPRIRYSIRWLMLTTFVIAVLLFIWRPSQIFYHHACVQLIELGWIEDGFWGPRYHHEQLAEMNAISKIETSIQSRTELDIDAIFNDGSSPDHFSAWTTHNGASTNVVVFCDRSLAPKWVAFLNTLRISRN